MVLKQIDLYYLPSLFAQGVGVKAILLDLELLLPLVVFGWTWGEDSTSVGMVGMEYTAVYRISVII